MCNNSGFSTFRQTQFFSGHRVFSRHSNNRTTSHYTNSTPTTSTTTATSTTLMPAQPNATNTTSSKWVINLSSIPLPQHQKPLARGPNFAVVPRCPPKEAYITAMEEACIRLSFKEAEELRAETSQVLKKNCPHPNLLSARGRPGPSKNSGGPF